LLKEGKLHISFIRHSNLKSLGFPSEPDQLKPKSAKKKRASLNRVFDLLIFPYMVPQLITQFK